MLDWEVVIVLSERFKHTRSYTLAITGYRAVNRSHSYERKEDCSSWKGHGSRCICVTVPCAEWMCTRVQIMSMTDGEIHICITLPISPGKWTQSCEVSLKILWANTRRHCQFSVVYLLRLLCLEDGQTCLTEPVSFEIVTFSCKKVTSMSNFSSWRLSSNRLLINYYYRGTVESSTWLLPAEALLILAQLCAAARRSTRCYLYFVEIGAQKLNNSSWTIPILDGEIANVHWWLWQC